MPLWRVSTFAVADIHRCLEASVRTAKHINRIAKYVSVQREDSNKSDLIDFKYITSANYLILKHKLKVCQVRTGTHMEPFLWTCLT